MLPPPPHSHVQIWQSGHARPPTKSWIDPAHTAEIWKFQGLFHLEFLRYSPPRVHLPTSLGDVPVHKLLKPACFT